MQPIVTDADCLERVDNLVGRACKRQVWFLLLDEHGVQLPALIPIEGYPAAPGGDEEALLAQWLAEIMSSCDALEAIVVWERRLGEASVPAERLWARRLDAECRAIGVRLRAQVISHRRGVRLFPRAEYDIASEAGESSTPDVGGRR